jgi:hypothetical protein
VGISRFPGRTEDALGVAAWAGDYMPGHRGPCQHRKKNCGSANQSEFCHAVLPLGCKHNTQVRVRIPLLVPKR